MIDVTITNNTFFYIYPNEDLILILRNLILLNKEEKKINFILKNNFYDNFYHKGLYISFYNRKKEEEEKGFISLNFPLKILEGSENEENLRKYKNYLLNKYIEGEGEDKDEDEDEDEKIENLYYLNPIAHFNIYYCKLLRKKVEEIKKIKNINIEIYFSF